MEFFGDGTHVRLRNRMHGAYLHADEDGARVSLSPRRASLNTAWRVHRVRRGGGGYVLLHSAAYGRYLALSPQRVSLVYAGHTAVQAAYDAPEQGDVLWEAVRVADEADDVLMLHVSNRLLRAATWNPVLRSPVYVDMDNAGTMMHRVVEPIPLRQAPPVLPGPTELPRGVVLRRTIIYMRANNQGKFDPLDRRTYGFSGRSLFHLTGDLANQLRENFHRITLCVLAGSQGRLTPLVIDLPADEQPMEIVVFTTGSEAALTLRHPDVDAA
ncbi:hypothetical protein PAHAL_4G317100 [Panicum hallii]|uniref:Uncharacterized protein n=1 Tax=Panicum hallii TaxID=206008 RepID=A0A2T8JEM0_9POAL|nr:hypothetical protein PAHAL_4G317100 [Panicum hallii]